MVRQVSLNRVIKDGFIQAYFIKDRYEILLSTINKGTGLDLHHHSHTQFGYCFWGSFRFFYNDDYLDINPGSSYLLASSIPHYADALDTFYALDFKYDYPVDLGGNRILQNVFHTEAKTDGVSIEKTVIGSTEIIKIDGNGTLDVGQHMKALNEFKNVYAVVSQDICLSYEEEKFVLEPMKIYELTINSIENMTLNMKDSSIVFIVL
ncbi:MULTISPECIES: AraC family ligand binding domain-containing protein [Acetivibrio]|uniref:Uncharacterized protein n=2 Tax=Acetivibrio TaxID=35829 RepID=A0A2S8R773_9FIRM|nr:MULTISPECIES: AraC family ligand binding domain-containing protein [Acetivibrio]PQQ65648.1 hypothetical protein B9R14_01925 [Acetivibrio saccincola]GAE86875.1 hypothetical protein JCM21531_206 [Acetivibrio straminisolvens JCM 21531]